MACDYVYDDDGKLIAIRCGSSWGIGGYYHCHDESCECGGYGVYGFPPREMNPENFTPDEESCTEKEIASWEEALAAWRRAHGARPE